MSRLGRRGGFLLICGVMWILTAISLPTADNFQRDVQFPHEELPLYLREILWLGAAVVAIFCAFRREPGQDKWGFILLCIPAAQRCVSYFTGLVESLIWPDRYGQLFWPGLTSGIIYLLVVSVIMLIASWPEPRIFIRRLNE